MWQGFLFAADTAQRNSAAGKKPAGRPLGTGPKGTAHGRVTRQKSQQVEGRLGAGPKVTDGGSSCGG